MHPWKAVNCTALGGWWWLGLQLKQIINLAALSKRSDGAVPPPDAWAFPHVAKVTLMLELVCCVEVVRMLVGNLKGNVYLGVGLHYVRLFIILAILPYVGNHVSCVLVLLAWVVTETCRYPYYIFGGQRCMTLRYFAPVITFPWGCAAEAWAIHVALPQLDGVLHYLAYAQILGNVAGGIMAYPAIARKGIAVLRGSDGQSGGEADAASVARNESIAAKPEQSNSGGSGSGRAKKNKFA